MKGTGLLAALLTISYGHASESVFSVHDDVLAFPQYEIVFAESYISEDEADARRSSSILSTDTSNHDDPGSELSSLHSQAADPSEGRQPAQGAFFGDRYEDMILRDRPYLCTIPHVEPVSRNETRESTTRADQEKEVARAADRGWELLQDMEGKPCLYFSTGWWSYSFCYNSQVKQFHSLPPGTNGAPIHEPAEDPTTPSYVLGKFEKQHGEEKKPAKKGEVNSPATALVTRAETSYLVKKLTGGTACDLTGKERKIEVEFHCNPQRTDHISWIKETATCAYLMIVNTPRLCDDVAFQPPKAVKANPIVCREILKPEEVADWETRKTAEATRKMIDHEPTSPRLFVGDIEVGGMKEVGREGRRIEKGRAATSVEERAETVAAQKNGKIEGLSKAELRKRNLNPEAVEAFRKELQKRAGAKDWKIQIWDEANGQLELRGIIASEDNGEDGSSESYEEISKDEDGEEEEGGEGSEEVYKDEI